MTRPDVLGTARTSYLGYLGDVAAALADLAPTERDELLETVADHLESIAADSGGDVDRESLTRRLGAPSVYAAQLAAAAGVDLAAHPSRAFDVASVWTVVRNWQATRVSTAYLARLVPGWWAVRGYLLGGLLIATSAKPNGYDFRTGVDLSGANLLRHWRPEYGGYVGASMRWILLPLLAIVVASIALGMHGEKQRTASARFWNRAADAAGVLAAVLMPTWWISPLVYAYVSQ